MNPDPNPLKPTGTQSKETMDVAAAATHDALRSTQQSAGRAVGKVADKVDEARGQFAPEMDKMTDAASVATDKAKDVFSEATNQLRERAKKASGIATDYVKDEPLKAMLIAAVTGALLMALLSVMARSRY